MQNNPEYLNGYPEASEEQYSTEEQIHALLNALEEAGANKPQPYKPSDPIPTRLLHPSFQPASTHEPAVTQSRYGSFFTSPLQPK